MSFCTVLSAAVQGLSVEMIRVEADVSNGLPMFHMVGYLSSEVKEASERVRTAIRNSGMKLPAKKIIVNLAPATVRKRGASFDLPIALAVLAAMNYVPEEALKGVAVIGEVSLEGKIRGVSGVLPIVMEAKNQGCTACILPEENEIEGRLVSGIKILPADNLEKLCAYLNGDEKELHRKKQGRSSAQRNIFENKKEDFSDISGQNAVKRAAEIAVAGGHNLLMAGPPGSGKSMIARRIATILPELSLEESLEITRIYSVLGMIDKEQPLITRRPFRSVHHTITKTALVGGGMTPRPGEISMAHGGVLFLDELPEFSRNALEVLRQPMEEGQITISRTEGKYSFPARFQLVAAMNPCKCGYYPDRSRCHCLPGEVNRYLRKISRPLLDRIDICMETPKVEYRDISTTAENESSAAIRERVEAARRIQKKRYEHCTWQYNSHLKAAALQEFCSLETREQRIMELAFERMNLSARGYHRIIKVARTIADLEGEENIREPHLLEAIGYRSADQKIWE